MSLYRQIKRRVLWAALVCIALGWAAPLLVRVNYWKQGIAAALGHSFRRPVQIGDVHLTILQGLGFQMENVSLAEDPRFGIEPFARIGTLDAHLALSALWSGRLEFSSLTLQDASINVARSADGHWNMESLWSAATPSQEGRRESAAGVPAPAAMWPRIHIQDGRINFKSGNEKRAVRLDDFSMDLTPPASPGAPWSFRIEATPERAGLALPLSSTLQAQGQFGPVNSAMVQDIGVPLRADWRADEASLEDILSLALGHDFGVRAKASLQGRIAGTTSLLRISATASITNLHRWDLLAPAADVRGGIRASLSGVFDASQDSLELASLEVPLGEGSALIRGRIDNVTGTVQPQLEATFEHVPLDRAADLARRFLPRWDPRVRLDGVADGFVRSTASLEDLSGQIQVHGATLHAVPQGDAGTAARQIRFSDFAINFQGADATISPVDARLDRQAVIHLTGGWNFAQHSSELHLAANNTSPSDVYEWARLWGVPAAPQWLALDPRRGSMDAKIDFSSRQGEGLRFAGWSRISNAVVHFARSPQPAVVSDARIQFANNDITIEPLSIQWGPVQVSGSSTLHTAVLRARAPESGSPGIEFRLRAAALDSKDLAELMLPAQRESGQWLGAPGAPKLSLAHWPVLHGRVEVAGLRYRGLEWKNLAGELRLQGQKIELSDASAELAKGTHSGSATISFLGDAPEISWDNRFSNLDLEELPSLLRAGEDPFAGRISGRLQLWSRGRTWAEVMSQWTGSGDAAGRGISIRDAKLNSAFQPEGVSPTEVRFASFSSVFEIANGQIHIAHMAAAPVASLATPNDGPRGSGWNITGTAGLNRTLKIMVQQAGRKQPAVQIEGTLEEPRVSRADAQLARTTVPNVRR